MTDTPTLSDAGPAGDAPETPAADLHGPDDVRAEVRAVLADAGLLRADGSLRLPSRPRARHGISLLLLWLMVGVIVGGIVEYKFNVFGLMRGDAPALPAAAIQPVLTPQPDPTQLNLFDTSEALATAIEFACQSTVSITAEGRNPDTGIGMIRSQGSGVVVRVDTERAYIVTNSHVIRDFTRISCTWRDYEVNAERVGTDPATDLAVISLRLGDLPVQPKAAVFADSELVKPGHLVVAIGSPSGFRNSATLGIVSALDRTGSEERASGYADDLQTSAPINRGSSGGPLVDIRGRVVGINTWKIENSEGLGFAIPAYLVQRVASDLIERGEVRRAALGITIKELNEVGLAQELGPGVLVRAVSSGTPAQDAGMQEADIILAIDDVPVHSVRKLKTLIAHHYPGDHITIVIRRAGKVITLPVRLGLLQ